MKYTKKTPRTEFPNINPLNESLKDKVEATETQRLQSERKLIEVMSEMEKLTKQALTDKETITKLRHDLKSASELVAKQTEMIESLEKTVTIQKFDLDGYQKAKERISTLTDDLNRRMEQLKAVQAEYHLVFNKYNQSVDRFNRTVVIVSVLSAALGLITGMLFL